MQSNERTLRDSIPIEYLNKIAADLKQSDPDLGWLFAAGIKTAIQLYQQDYQPEEKS